MRPSGKHRTSDCFMKILSSSLVVLKCCVLLAGDDHRRARRGRGTLFQPRGDALRQDPHAAAPRERDCASDGDRGARKTDCPRRARIHTPLDAERNSPGDVRRRRILNVPSPAIALAGRDCGFFCFAIAVHAIMDVAHISWHTGPNVDSVAAPVASQGERSTLKSIVRPPQLPVARFHDSYPICAF